MLIGSVVISRTRTRPGQGQIRQNVDQVVLPENKTDFQLNENSFSI